MYNLHPKINIKAENVIEKDLDCIISKIEAKKLIVECYHGVDYVALEEKILSKFPAHKLIKMDDYFIETTEYMERVRDVVTDDRVFGKMNDFEIKAFYKEGTISEVQAAFDRAEKVIVYGVGASYIQNADKVIYLDLARWEIQLRYRKGLCNFNMDNVDMEIITKFKIGYFLDWRMCDKIKRGIKFDYLLDTNNGFKLIHYTDYKEGLDKAVKTPFRLVPYFDPGVWGGNWMKQEFNLPENGSNYAWSFDGVVEENSVLLNYGEDFIEIPAINVLFNNPKGLLGDYVYGIYGAEWPIRFDYLDTMNGQNLSLQVHPKKEYIKEKFNMAYTQDESYYFMDCKDEAFVYLGTQTGIDVEDFKEDLLRAERGEISFPAEKYVNKIPVKKHDHVSIPAGTIHCSGADTVVLEISATPYIFTFKLWDWDRVGFNGLPRPIHLTHGFENIDFYKNTEWVTENLVSRFDGSLDVQKTGLHPDEPIDTFRYRTSTSNVHNFEERCVMGNLVSGEKMMISSPTGEFEDYSVNYAETFIIPGDVTEFEIKSCDGKEIMYLLANIR